MSSSSSGRPTDGPNAGENWLTPYQPFVANLSTVVGSFAIGLGVISLLQFHSRAIARQRTGWGNSVALPDRLSWRCPCSAC